MWFHRIRGPSRPKANDRPLEHRGPDDSGYFLEKGVGLGHRRLSIIDLRTGHQPLSNEDGTIWIVFNGEIYNYRELRADLRTKHSFATQSDTEVIVHLYEEDPLGFAQRLDGMFALAIYDTVRKRLTLAGTPSVRNPYTTPLHEGTLFFASEIKALLETDIPREVDNDSLFSFLEYQYTRGTSTMFRGIKKVPASHTMTYENGVATQTKYWDLHEDHRDISEADALDKLRGILDESARKRMIADVHIGAYLSGGIDSSAVVALSRPMAEYDFHTFSLGFPNLSELPYAKMVAEHLETTHHEIVVDDGQMIHAMDRMAYHYDEPVGDVAILNNFLLSQEACKHVKVVLAGEGGDELFAGYEDYSRCIMIKNLRSKPLLGLGPLESCNSSRAGGT